jgi:hypothetical protein
VKIFIRLAGHYAQVKPANADGFVNWLETMVETAIGKSAPTRFSVVDKRAHHRGPKSILAVVRSAELISLVGASFHSPS